MSEQLKPCPFCGKDNLELSSYNFVRCLHCLYSHKLHYLKWNTRPIEDKLRAEAENERLKVEKKEWEDTAFNRKAKLEKAKGYLRKIEQGKGRSGTPHHEARIATEGLKELGK